MSTTREIDILAVVNSIDDPILVVSSKGIVELANRSACAFAGGPLQDFDLAKLPLNAPEKLLTFLSRCSGSAGALIGAIALPKKSGGDALLRCYGNAVSVAGRTAIFLRFKNQSQNQFSALNSRIGELNVEIRRHLNTQARLAESLREREVLIREIHHRVKNNIQVLHGMILSAAHETGSAEARDVLKKAAQQLAAVGATQQALYSSKDLSNAKADEFLNEFAAHFRTTLPNNITLNVHSEPFALSQDVALPLALILNELLTNAVKYGLRSTQTPTISAELRQKDGKVELVVQDNGPGFNPRAAQKRASGLGLVRGLARQLNGEFRIVGENGTRCILTFEMPQ